MRPFAALAVVTALLAPTGAAFAAEPPAAAAVCANCHGTDGRRRGPIPAIAGKPAVLLADKLRDFKADKIANATVMPRLVKGLSEAEIDQVAAYFASLR